MVQDDKASGYSLPVVYSKDPAARKAGYDAMQRAEAEKRRVQEQQRAHSAQADKNKYGAWGPVFKDRQTFNSMHFC